MIVPWSSPTDLTATTCMPPSLSQAQLKWVAEELAGAGPRLQDWEPARGVTPFGGSVARSPTSGWRWCTPARKSNPARYRAAKHHVI